MAVKITASREGSPDRGTVLKSPYGEFSKFASLWVFRVPY